MKKIINSDFPPQSEVAKIVANLRAAVNALRLQSVRLRDLILDLARYSDENKLCEQNQISRKIKQELQEEIREEKITPKWIEESLPPEYKRRYRKSDLSSLSKENNQKQVTSMINQGSKSYTVTDFDSNVDGASTDPSTHRVSQKEIDELQRSVNGFEISKNTVQFTIPRKKYENLKAAIEESNAAIYVVFKDGAFQYAYSDNAEV